MQEAVCETVAKLENEAKKETSLEGIFDFDERAREQTRERLKQ